MNTIDISCSEEVYSVSRLNRDVRLLLEENFGTLWVEGEISNFVAPNSGHWYFSLKDAQAQIRCAMFRLQNRKLGFTPKDGMHVLMKGRVSLYEGRGDFQLLVEHLEEAGEGKLRQAFEALKKRLADAGLFDAAHKKLLPPLPQTIGVITSTTGAAIRDILTVLKRRFSCVSVIIYPTLVQGELAATNIVNAIETANQRKECDVLIVARGGGSLEDLWPFNEERVAYAIYRSNIPIISGIGHEIDFTIADFVADVRAPTPSAAAELVTPDREELLASITPIEKQFIRLMMQKFQQFQQTIMWMNKHLQQQHPKRRLAEKMQHLDLQEITLKRLLNNFINDHKIKLHILNAKLYGCTPAHRIRESQQLLISQKQLLQNAITFSLQQKQQLLSNFAATLDALSPLATLKRGFAIATLAENKKILRNVKQVAVGDKISVRLLNGSLGCAVEKIEM
ncbi:MAG TPA: exodeoxyribonuclease VII large subunit [Gammaproteobacteria bacterium]|nr:exodeoxyribonuclease VII large subunit [Gammaproteobacteria bacterium]